MPRGGGPAGSKMLGSVPDKAAQALPRALQERRKKILEEAEKREEEEREEREEHEREREKRERERDEYERRQEEEDQRRQEEYDRHRSRGEAPESLRVLAQHGISGNPDQIRRAWKAFSLRNHPDKGGDEEVFKRVSNAYDKYLISIGKKGGRRTRKRRHHKRKTHRRR